MNNKSKIILAIISCLVLAFSFSSCSTLKNSNEPNQTSVTYNYYQQVESTTNTQNIVLKETSFTQSLYNESSKTTITVKPTTATTKPAATTTKPAATTTKPTTTTTKPTTTTTKPTTTTTKPTTTTTKPTTTTTKPTTTTTKPTTTTTKPTTTTTKPTTTTTKPTTTTTKPTTTQSYSDVLIISDTRTICDQTINTDVYITSTGVASFSNVTINGNVYCYGKLTLNNCVGKGLYGYQYGSWASCSAYDGSHGYITGGGSYDILYIKNDALDYAFNKWGKQ